MKKPATRHAHPSARPQLETRNSKLETHPHAEAALKSFLQPATPDSPHAESVTSPQKPETRNSKLETHSPSPWTADLADLESRHHAALTQLATQHQIALSAVERRHQSALAALEQRLAAAEQTTADLSGQLRELR